MRINKLKRYWIGVGFAFLIIIILYLIEGLALIPLIIVMIVLYGLFPCLLGVLAGFFAKKVGVLAGALAAMVFLLLWVTASPPLWISYGRYILNRLNVGLDPQNVLRFILSIAWY